VLPDWLKVWSQRKGKEGGREMNGMKEVGRMGGRYREEQTEGGDVRRGREGRRKDQDGHSSEP